MLNVFPAKAGDKILLPFDTDKKQFYKIVTRDYDPLAIYGINDF